MRDPLENLTADILGPRPVGRPAKSNPLTNAERVRLHRQRRAKFPPIKRVLISCERSGIVREAFRALGIDAFSNDLEPADDGSDYHIQADTRQIIRIGWDLIITHPPCTALSVSGNPTYAEGKPKHHQRLQSIAWTTDLWNLAKKHAPRVAMENPVGVLPFTATQFIQPWQFGHGETKATGLWLHNLPPLNPTDVVEGREARIHRMSPGPDRQRLRSETYSGIAQAMADQWHRL
ncbi:MAG: DNA cytosine methyltransferase [Pseudohongiella sp.]|nr:DNA cytosine methyltransferase [Pseudohongiella sp.]